MTDVWVLQKAQRIMEIHLGDNKEAQKDARIHFFWDAQISKPQSTPWPQANSKI